MSVFVCHTAYHLYVTLAMRLVDKIESPCTVLMTDNIPDVEKYATRLDAESVFDQIVILHHKDIWPEWSKGSFHVTWLCGKLMPWRERKLRWLLSEDIWMYNDYSNIGSFFLKHKKQYHLMEDGCGTYVNNIHHVSKKAQKLKSILYRLFGLPYAIGMTGLCLDVTVNNVSKTRTPFAAPLIEMPLAELTGSLTRQSKDVMLRVFNLQLDIDHTKKTLLLVTQPLMEMRVVKTWQDSIGFYEKRLTPYINDYQIYVKPHPRDMTDYSKLINGNATVVDRTVPIEILDMLENVWFDLGVTYNSTSANSAKYCQTWVKG